MTVAAESIDTAIFDIGVGPKDEQVTEETSFEKTFEFRDDADVAVDFTGWTIVPTIFNADPDAPIATQPDITGDATGNIKMVFTETQITASAQGTHNYRMRATKAGGLVKIWLCGKFVIKDCNKARKVA